MRFRNEFLNTYLEYVEDTESPRIFHIWSALTAIGGIIGRKAYLDFGIGPIFPNMFTLLVGPPGVRKSTAINTMVRRLRGNTSIRFAPDDTGGQRQGLIKAIENSQEDDEAQELKGLIDKSAELSADEMLGALSQINLTIDPANQHALFVAASEFNTFIGQNNIEMVTFLAKMWDGEEYEYRLKSSQQKLSNPLVTIIGGTTPTNIATAMPVEAVGQGFMSRLILVYARDKYKRVPRPRPMDPALEAKIDSILRQINEDISGPFEEDSEASKLLDSLYDKKLKLEDHRFVYYAERRHVHLIKLCLCLAASNGRLRIRADDVREADLLLTVTEEFMPEALGEYGMSPLAKAKQLMVDYLRAAQGPVRPNILWAMMHKDIRNTDFKQVVSDLINAGKIMKVNTHDGPAYVFKTVHKTELSKEIENALTESDEAAD